MAEDIVLYPVSRIIADYLIEQGVGFTPATTTDWSVVTSAEPELPIKCITVFDEPAEKIAKTTNGIFEKPGITIRIRGIGSDYENGLYRAKLVMDALDDLYDWSWVGDSAEYNQTVVFKNAFRNRGIMVLGKDEDGRYIFNLEYILTVSSITDN